MRNFFKAFLAFLFIAVVAQLLHNKNSIAAKTKATLNQPVDSISEKTSIKRNIPLAKDKITSTPKVVFNPKITTLNFNYKFITSANKKRVLILKKFSYVKDSIFNFLNRNQQKELVITGNYRKNEAYKNTSNLGIKRAIYLKNELVNYGVNPDRISIKSSLSNYKYDAKGYYADGIKIEHQNLSASKQTLLNKKITRKTLPSNIGPRGFEPSKTLYAYTLEVKKYLQKNPTATILITGYGNIINKKEDNYTIGLQKAKNIAAYFVSQGIDTTYIKTTSKHKRTPRKNSTAKQSNLINKRIEIIVN